VVAAGDNSYGQCNVGRWTDIVQVAAGRAHTAGLRSDGTVVAAGMEVELAKWNLIEAARSRRVRSLCPHKEKPVAGKTR